MDKQTFMIDKLYNEILAELQVLYAYIGINKLAYDYDSYAASIAKLVAVGQALSLDTGEIADKI